MAFFVSFLGYAMLIMAIWLGILTVVYSVAFLVGCLIELHRRK